MRVQIGDFDDPAGVGGPVVLDADEDLRVGGLLGDAAGGELEADAALRPEFGRCRRGFGGAGVGEEFGAPFAVGVQGAFAVGLGFDGAPEFVRLAAAGEGGSIAKAGEVGDPAVRGVRGGTRERELGGRGYGTGRSDES